MCSVRQYVRLALCATLLLLQAVAQAAGYVDVLELPAKASALAQRSPLLDVARAGERLVAVGQRGHILYSDDAGQSWQQAAVPVSADLNAVHFPTAEQGWAVGNDGVILHSNDAGQTWSKQLDGRAIGALLVEHYGALASAEPANEHWPLFAAEGQRLVEEGADKPFLDVWFADAQRGYAVGVFNLILATADGGQSWTPLQDRTDNPQGLHLNAIGAVDGVPYIAGEQGLLLRWNAEQQRFVALQIPYAGSLFGVIGLNGELLAYGLRGHILRSTDAGASWSTLDSGLQSSITAAAWDGSGRIHLFSQAGHVLRLLPQGRSLEMLPQSVMAPIAGADFAAADSLALVGNRGVRSQRLP